MISLINDAQIDGYENSLELLKEHQKCLFVLCTGLGKSYIGLYYLQEHPNEPSLLIAPNNLILEQYRQIAERYDSHALDNTVLLKYSDLSLDSYSFVYSTQFSNILIDETHRAGADTYEVSLNNLLDTQQDCNLIGFTATPVRYLDNARDMGAELFDGHLAAEIYLKDAIERGLVVEPKYVSAVFKEEKEISETQERINNLDDQTLKDELSTKLLSKCF